VNVLKGHFGSVKSVAFSNDGSRVVSGFVDCTVQIWNAMTGESEKVLGGHSDRVKSPATEVMLCLGPTTVRSGSGMR
jgi:WD40 repeat protein